MSYIGMTDYSKNLNNSSGQLLHTKVINVSSYPIENYSDNITDTRFKDMINTKNNFMYNTKPKVEININSSGNDNYFKNL
jgi:hypothetical protein